MKKTASLVLTALLFISVNALAAAESLPRGNGDGSTRLITERSMEKLDRGLVAVQTDGGVFVSWRMLGDEAWENGYNLYRDGKLIKSIEGVPADKISGEVEAVGGVGTNYLDTDGGEKSRYSVAPVAGGKEGERCAEVTPWEKEYIRIPVTNPGPQTVTLPCGVGELTSEYALNDCSVGDLDGDGDYELIVKWEPYTAVDNSKKGMTNPYIMQAYEMKEGGGHTPLWTINLGTNVRGGAHYLSYVVYDFDGNGRAELAMRTSHGTRDGAGRLVCRHEGKSLAEAEAECAEIDYRIGNEGRVSLGDEYLTIFDGETGAAIDSIPFEPARGNALEWGGMGDYGNRSERYLASLAYLDGKHPSIITARGYYERTALAAFDFDGEKLSLRWKMDTADEKYRNDGFEGQGNHQLSTADLDGDGDDEIITGSMTVGEEYSGGKPQAQIWYTTLLRHGDALHVAPMLPDDDTIHIVTPHEEETDTGAAMDVHTGGHAGASATQGTGSTEILLSVPSKDKKDVGRYMAGDVDPRYKGYELWGPAPFGTYGMGKIADARLGRLTLGNADLSENVKLYDSLKVNYNFGTWWHGNLLRSQFNALDALGGKYTPEEYAPYFEDLDYGQFGKNSETLNTLVRTKTFEGARSINYTKANPALQADLIGDWREELLLPEINDQGECFIRLYTTTETSEYKLPTLMHDPQYRMAVAWQNNGYNQPPTVGFYLGHEMKFPQRRNDNYVEPTPKFYGLSGITADGKPIDGFNRGVNYYEIELGADDEVPKIAGVPARGCSVSRRNEDDTVILTVSDGRRGNEYRVKFIRPKSAVTDILINGSPVGGFSPDRHEYEYSMREGEIEVTVSASTDNVTVSTEDNMTYTITAKPKYMPEESYTVKVENIDCILPLPGVTYADDMYYLMPIGKLDAERFSDKLRREIIYRGDGRALRVSAGSTDFKENIMECAPLITDDLSGKTLHFNAFIRNTNVSSPANTLAIRVGRNPAFASDEILKLSFDKYGKIRYSAEYAKNEDAEAVNLQSLANMRTLGEYNADKWYYVCMSVTPDSENGALISISVRGGDTVYELNNIRSEFKGTSEFMPMLYTDTVDVTDILDIFDVNVFADEREDSAKPSVLSDGVVFFDPDNFRLSETAIDIQALPVGKVKYRGLKRDKVNKYLYVNQEPNDNNRGDLPFVGLWPFRNGTGSTDADAYDGETACEVAVDGATGRKYFKYSEMPPMKNTKMDSVLTIENANFDAVDGKLVFKTKIRPVSTKGGSSLTLRNGSDQARIASELCKLTFAPDGTIKYSTDYYENEKKKENHTRALGDMKVFGEYDKNSWYIVKLAAEKREEGGFLVSVYVHAEDGTLLYEDENRICECEEDNIPFAAFHFDTPAGNINEVHFEDFNVFKNSKF